MTIEINVPRAIECNEDKLLSILCQIEAVCNEYTKDIDLQSSHSLDSIGSDLSEASAALKTDAPFEQTIFAQVDVSPASNNDAYYVSVNLSRNVRIAVLSVQFWSGKFYDYQQAFDVKQKIEQHFYN